MISSICHIVNYNLYETKRHFAQSLHEACLRKGITSTLIETPDAVLEISAVQQIVKENPQLTCSFNTLLPMENGQFLADYLEIPHLSFLVDPPVYVMNLVKSPKAILSCVDHFDCDFLRTSGFQNLFFFPHAVDADLETDPKQPRPLEVVFAGSCYDYENLRQAWQSVYPAEVSKVLDDAIEIMLSSPYTTFVQALVQAWDASDMDPGGVDFKELCFYVDNYVRGVDRVSLIKSIKEVPIHIYGGVWDNTLMVKGWEYYLKGQSNVTVHPPVPYQQMLEVLKQTKVCLNSAPFFRNGSHERIFNGLAAGAMVVTTDNLYIRDQFTEDDGVAFYRSGAWDKVNEAIHTVLQNEGRRIESVVKGQRKVLQRHTWDSRVDLLLKELPSILIQTL